MGINAEIRSVIERRDSCGQIIVLKDSFQSVSKTKGMTNGGIVYDGIVDLEKFNGLVFLLKEATKAGTKKFGNGWSLVEQAAIEAGNQNSQVPKKWETLCYWTEAYKDSTKTYKDAAKCGGNLAEIAIVNIKKTAGEGTSENAPMNTIMKNAEYKQILRDEITAIKKTGKQLLVICGGTFDWAKKLYDVARGEVKLMDCGAEYFQRDGIIFLNFVHPSVRCGKEVTYAYAQAVFAERKRKNL